MFCVDGNGSVKISNEKYPFLSMTITETSGKKSREYDDMSAKKKLGDEWESRARDLDRKNIEPEFRCKTLDAYEPKTEGQRKLLASVRDLMAGRIKSLLVAGPCGTGKTMLGSAAVDALGGRIYSMYEIVTMIRQGYSRRDCRTELEIMDELSSVPMLAIDELGRTSNSDAELNWLSFLVDKRHTRGLPLMIMTNRHLRSSCERNGCHECVEAILGNDIISRIAGGGRVVEIERDAPDYRRVKK